MTTTTWEALAPPGMTVLQIPPMRIQLGDLFHLDGDWWPVIDMRADLGWDEYKTLIFRGRRPVTVSGLVPVARPSRLKEPPRGAKAR
ncbi:hypothetical protein GCM10020221_14880 [Streptomyces thioluteus]|uniref:Uncharacterized protein n=1 Tax=Streptomyces thioluteus TaxID=66431 RepID=A0ABN3WLQ5_STRTU